VSNAPNSYDTNPPKFIADIRRAYIVPSIFFGHILQANTNTGIVFNSPIT
jgi:hypothetical protein